MTGSAVQLYNGLALIATFFSCRLVYGTYQSYRVFSDVWRAIGSNPSASSLITQAQVMRFATESSTVPRRLGLTYLASNTVLNCLNNYWFYKMLQALYKRFQLPVEVPLQDKPVVGTSTALEPNLSSTVKPRIVAGMNDDSELDVVN
jgi:hypothetical protein